MAINKAMRAALKALSYPADLDIKKTYQFQRQVINLTSPPLVSPFYKVWDHKIPCGDHEVPIRIFKPLSTASHDILLFFHGGGWVTGNIDSYTKVCVNMAKLTGCIVASVDYRLAPEYRFPAATEDCYAAAREVYQKTALLDARYGSVTMIGDSAGGNLAAAVSLMARDRQEFSPTGQILLYPATYNDHSDASPFPSVRENGTGYLLTSRRIRDYMDLYLGGEEDWENPYFAPLLAKDFTNLPRTLVITAQYDPLRDEGEEYARRLQQAGCKASLHRIPDALHGYFSLPPRFAQVKTTYALINQFLDEVKRP